MKKILFYNIILLTFLACETDSYEKGQGKFSLMLTDMAEVSVNSDKQAVSFTTDDGDSYQLVSPATTEWIETADTTYRAVVFYNKVEQGKAEHLALSQVATMVPIEHWRFKEPTQDPVGFESAWLAKSKKYLNLGLLFKSGYVDDAIGRHRIGVAQDTILLNADKTSTVYYRFLHAQEGTPQHFTNRHFCSLLLPQKPIDSISISIVTYTGTIERRFALK